MSTNVKIAKIETTQSIQYFNFPLGQGSGYAPDNSIPLVSHKPTILRVNIDAKANDPSVPVPASMDGIVWAFNPTSSKGGIYKSANGPIAARDATTIDRTNSNHTLNFVIPWDVCDNEVLCEVAIFDPASQGTAMDVTFLNLDFTDVPPMNVHSVLIHYTGVDYFNNPVDAQTTGFNVLFAMDYLLRTYPVSDFIFDGCEVVEWGDRLSTPSNFYALSDKLGAMRAISGTNDVYIGLIPPSAGCSSPCGLGGGGTALFFSDDTLTQVGAAHEIGHALGRTHTPECSGGQGDDYPQYNGFPRDSIGECGIDSRTLQVFDPRVAVDYMSYCGRPNWTSPYGYLKILAALQSGSFSPSGYGALETMPGTMSGEALYDYVSFRLHPLTDARKGQRVDIRSHFQVLRTTPRSLVTADTNERIELLDDKDDILFVAPCLSSYYSDEGIPFKDRAAFFPHFEEAKSLNILSNQSVVAKYQLAGHPPKLKILEVKHTDNLSRLKWEGSADKGIFPALQYHVRFTNDGKKWRPVAATISDNHIVVNTDLLPGGDNCRFQIMASAGFRTTCVETKPIRLEIKPRGAFLALPKADSEFEVGSPITFCGTGFSPDFGACKSDEVIWTSMAVGIIGIGQQFATREIPVGFHWITMNVPDGMCHMVTKSVSIRVIPKKRCGADLKPPRVPKYKLGKHPCRCDH